MNLSPLRCTLAILLCAGSLAAQTVTIADDLFPGAVDGDVAPLLTRLVDDLSGEPIAGGEVFLVRESKTPIAGEFWFTYRGKSDADGFVRIPRPGALPWHWQVMKHPQLGVAERSDYVEPIWRIGRTFDVPLEVQDWAGRPAAGARIGFCGGCGHSPDIANTTAAANGFAVLRGIDPQQDIRDLYVQHPGLNVYYDSVRWRPGEPPMVVRCGFGPVLSGTVVDFGGKPVAGAFVRGGGFHRGPWGKTAADGTFTILGCAPNESPNQVVLPDGREVYFQARSRSPVTLRLNDPADGDNEGTVEMPAETAVPLPLPPRRVRVQVDGAPSAETHLDVHYPGMPEPTADDVDIEIPANGPFVLTVRAGGLDGAHERRFTFADGAAVPDRLVVRWVPDVRVVGRAVDAMGKPLSVRARWRSRWSDDADDQGKWIARPEGIDVVAEAAGWALLEVQPQDASGGRRLAWVLLPEPGQQERVDLGTVVVGAPARLHVVDAGGAPLPAARVSFARPGWQEVGQSLRWPLAADGSWSGPDLREGDTIVVQRDAPAVPFRTVLQGEGPWQITPPAGALDLDVVGADGAPLSATVVLGDHYALADNGHFALRGLPLGPMRCYVSAPGHRSAIVDATVTAAGGELRVELPPR